MRRTVASRVAPTPDDSLRLEALGHSRRLDHLAMETRCRIVSWITWHHDSRRLEASSLGIMSRGDPADLRYWTRQCWVFAWNYAPLWSVFRFVAVGLVDWSKTEDWSSCRYHPRFLLDGLLRSKMSGGAGAAGSVCAGCKI